eukprot:PLAT8552.1.p1 GENE.PLAT8552.1~~PLAT8552.1.p1  ORF type:complete len:206 (-),score=102.55 PLAT8552.1:161-724(-)
MDEAYKAHLDEVARDFPYWTLKKTQEYKDAFARYDVDRSGDLDLQEVTMMCEALGQTKTRLELLDLIKEVDLDNSGTISFSEFLTMFIPPGMRGDDVEEKPLPLFGRIYNTALGEKAEFFERKMREARGKTPEEIEAEVRAGAARRRLERQRAKEEAEAKRKAEEDAKVAAERRAAFKARAAMFEKS